MEIIRLTDENITTPDSHIYRLVERLDTFTMLECRSRQDVCLLNISSTLILDHIDTATDARSIINQVIGGSDEIKLIVIVDSDKNYALPLPSSITVNWHIVFSSEEILILDQIKEGKMHHVNNIDKVLYLLMEGRLAKA